MGALCALLAVVFSLQVRFAPGVLNNIWCANVVIPTKFKIGGKRLNSPTRPQKLSTYPHAKEQVEKTAKFVG